MRSNRPDRASSTRRVRSSYPRNGDGPGVTRRRLLGAVGVAGIGTVTAGCLDDDSGSEPTEDETETVGDDDPEPPFEIETIDARGSDEGEISVPEPETVLVVSFVNSHCPTSAEQISYLADATDDVGEEAVQFLTVNNLTGSPAGDAEELAEWWENETDGDWLIGIEDGDVSEYYDAESVPTTMVIDGDGEIYWQETGRTGASPVLEAIDEALESDAESDS